MIPARKIILASASPYRRDLLSRLHLPFECRNADIRESSVPGESPDELVRRLSILKADAVAATESDAVIIGSDQVAVLGSAMLTKPGDHEDATRQLQRIRGKRVNFVTGLCVLDSAAKYRQVGVVGFAVKFRDFTDAEIGRYLQFERPYDCAGSFKAERLGIALVECMDGDDPTALVGLPLIELGRMLRRAGIDVP